MDQSQDEEGGVKAHREFDTAPDHVTAYSDFINVMNTGTEIILSVYQTIPGYPDVKPPSAQSSRKATVILSVPHALRLGRLLTEHAEASLEASTEEDG